MLTPRYPDPVVDPWPGPARVAAFVGAWMIGGVIVELIGTWAWRLFA